MGFEAIFVIIALICMIGLLIFERFRPEMVVFFTLVIFLFVGIISPKQALSGFANEGVWTIAILFILMGVIQQSDFIGRFILKLMNKSRSVKGSLLKIMTPVTFLSAFLNNTPIVMLMIPVVRKWCEEKNIAPSKFLIPISYAAIFGGTITLIGTSTNLVVNGMMLDDGLSGFSMFQFAIIGIPASILAILYIITIGYRILPNRTSLDEAKQESKRSYLAEAVVDASCSLVGQKVNESVIFKTRGIILVEIIGADKSRQAPITGYEVIQEGDRLILTGLLESMHELEKVEGLTLELASGLTFSDLVSEQVSLVELIVSQGSDLAYKAVKDTNFRLHFNASIVSIHRNQRPLEETIGDVVLKPGDVILVLADHAFERKFSDSPHFYFLSEAPEIGTFVSKKKVAFHLIAFVAMILLAAFQVLSMFTASVLILTLFLITRSIHAEEIHNHVQFPTLLLIACSIGIGAAVTESGLATIIANIIVSKTEAFGIIGSLVIIYFVTNLLTETITNTAAAVIVFPIALEVSTLLSINPTATLLVLAIAASCSFSTPIGYQTNLMVYGAGGYKFTDYTKVGLPLNILFMVVSIAVVYLVYL